MSTQNIVVRRMAFEFPEDMPLVFIEGEPEETFLNIGVSLVLPYLEPYLIRTMRTARGQVTDQQLAHDLDQFVGQEGQHYRQHMHLNEVFRNLGCNFAALEEEMSADYQRFSSEESLRFNLAYAEGFEALTTIFALVFAERDKTGWHPAALDIFQWHLVEELEHRCVAFDVYEHVVGDYFYRVRGGFFAQRHLLGFMERAMLELLHADPERFEAWGGIAAHKRRMAVMNKRFLTKIAPRWLRTFSPFYTPHDIELSPEILALADRYTSRALRTS
jgi:predicted metal-dependent hydrolase